MSDEVHVVRPQGRLDGTNSPALEKQVLAVIDGGNRRLLIDLGELQYISSAGLRTALVVAKRMQAAGGRLALCSLNPQIAEVFKISGFDTILDIHVSAESATARLKGG
jgi:anti-anti-sigma factor